MRNLFRVLVATLVVALSVASCSDKGSFPTEPTPTPVPTAPVADMSSLSPEARAYVMATNIEAFRVLSGPRVWRWASGQIKLYFDPTLREEDVRNAASYWEKYTGGSITFQIVGDKASANITVEHTLVGLIENACGSGTPVPSTDRGFFSVGIVRIFQGLVPKCNDRSRDVSVIAHELGHAIGLTVHSSYLSEVMSSPSSGYLNISDPVKDAVYWIYHAPPGATPQ